MFGLTPADVYPVASRPATAFFLNLDKSLFAFVLWFVSFGSFAEVITDGTVGPSSNISGPNFDINASYGTQAGNNLFHSFSSFNIGAVESANFSGPASVRNVISRITGGSLSSIDGNITNSINGANLWMINPSGFMFGSNASINVTGAFHVSTGDYVAFDDGSRYQVGQNSNISLLTATPEGFGFLGKTRGKIILNGTSLSAPVGESMSFVGGEVDIENTALTAVDGTINIAAVSGRGRVSFSSPADPNGSGIVKTGGLDPAPVNVVGSTLDVAGDGGGSIFIKGGDVVIDADSQILNGSVNSAGGVIRIDGTAVLIDGGLIKSEAVGTASGANIVIDSRQLTINRSSGSEGDPVLLSKAKFGAQGGNIILEVDKIIKLDGGVIEIPQGIFAEREGFIRIHSDKLKLVNGGSISAWTQGTSATDRIIDISTSSEILLEGSSSRIELIGYSGSGGITTDNKISLNTRDLTLRNGAGIVVFSFGTDLNVGIRIDADNVNLRHFSRIYVESRNTSRTQGISIALRDSMQIDSGASIQTKVFSNGQGSNIDITAKNLSLTNGGSIGTDEALLDSSASGTGNIKITLAGDLAIIGEGLGKTGVFTVVGDSFEPEPNPDLFSRVKAGNIEVSADSISLERGIISSTATISGDAGGIELNAGDQIVISDSSIATTALSGAGGNIAINAVNLLVLEQSGVTAEARSGAGGNLEINAGNLHALEQSLITTEARAGTGGNIAINAGNLFALEQSVITTEARSGTGGNIAINAGNLLALEQSEITAEAFGVRPGFDGGNVDIDSVNVVLNGSQILARANAGNGGNITIVTEGLIVSADSIIDASSNTGIDGEVIIVSPVTDTNATNYDEVEFLDLSSFLNTLCGLRSAQNRSSFVMVGKGGLPSDPGDYQVINLAASNKGSAFSINDRPPINHPIASLDTSFLCSN